MDVINYLDFILLSILAYCIIRGIFRGLIKELSAIIGVFGGLYAAYSYYLYIAELLSRWIKSISYQNIISFLLIFCIIFVGINLLGTFIKYTLKVMHLGRVDKISGSLFGLLKGVLISAVLLIALIAFLPKNSSTVTESRLSPCIIVVSKGMIKFVTKHIQERFSINNEGLKKVWEIER